MLPYTDPQRWWPPVNSKDDFADRYAVGEFGNMSPTWMTCDALLAWGCREFGTGPSRGLYHLRSKIPGHETYYKLHWSQAVSKWLDQTRPQDWYVSQQIPPEVERRLRLQGEVVQSLYGAGLDLYWTRVPLPMRDAFRVSARQSSGIISSLLLRENLCPNSYTWLQALLDRYPYHVVEFSTYECEWGNVPGFNTVFWEVRNY